MPPFMHFNQYSASAPIFDNHQHYVHHQQPNFVAQRQQNYTQPPLQAPWNPNIYSPRPNVPKRTPQRGHRSWESSRSSSGDWHVQWTPTLPSTPQLTDSPSSPSGPSFTIDYTSDYSTFEIPLTPEWFPAALPDTVPDFVLNPTTVSSKPYREPTPPSDTAFGQNMVQWEQFNDHESPFIRHDRRSPVARDQMTPELPPPFPVTRNNIRNIVISKRAMEANLVQQPASSTSLCEIIKEGQLCHLRRYERDGVFLRGTTVKFDKAFKHLSTLRDNLQHLVIGVKAVPAMLNVELVADEAVVSLLQSLPGLLEVRFHGFTKLTKRSFDAALIHCTKLKVLAITGTRVPGPEPRKLVYHQGRPHYAGGTGSLAADTLRSLLPNDGPVRDVAFIGRQLQFIDLSFQHVDDPLAKRVTALPGRFGNLVIMRELQSTTERYSQGTLEVSPCVDASKLQGNNRPINPVASTVGWPVA
ncbi:hypothetical protein FRC17_001392 [Serendipita sp. 399]|nr:hypothetical protein FRC17_001392 [Serendipita sp. 399]